MSGQFLLFAVGGRRFAVPVERVEGVLPPAPVTPMPFVPAWIDGLVMARGLVHAQIDLLAWLDPAERHRADRYELLQIVTPEGPSVVKVDRVLRLMAGHEVEGEGIAIIDPARLSFGELGGEAPDAPAEDFIEAPRMDLGLEVTAELTVVVSCVGERFAIPLRRVLEVTEAGEVESLPLAPPALVGLLPLRGRVLPLLSMAALLGGEASAGTRAVVAEMGGRPVALLVDRIIGLERVGELEEHPLLDQWHGLMGCWIGEGGQVTGLVHLDFLLEDEVGEELAAFLPADGGKLIEHPPEPSRQLLTFAVGDRLCAVEASEVRRVVEWQPPAALPEGGAAMDGVVQVLSDVLPVVDVGRRLGVAGDARAFLVASLGDELAALAVGQPGRIASVPVSAFHGLGDGKGMVDAVARIDGELAWVLSLDALAGQVPA